MMQMLLSGVKGPVPLLSLQALPAALASTPSAVWEPMIPQVQTSSDCSYEATLALWLLQLPVLQLELP